MKIKNIIKLSSTLFLILLFMMLSVNAGTTILNSCGKTSGWLSNEIYELNFNEVPSGYANSYCFRMGGVSLTNVTFTQSVDEIRVNKSINFFDTLVETTNTINGLDFLDLNIVAETGINFNWFIFQFGQTGVGGNTYTNLIMDNTTLNGIGYLALTKSTSAPRNNVVSNWNITNSKIIGKTSTSPFYASGSSGTSSITNVKINDSAFLFPSNNVLGIKDSAGSLNIIFGNSVITTGNYANTIGLSYYDSVLGNTYQVDSIDDNVADSDTLSNIFSSNMYKDLFGFTFFQDYNERRIAKTSNQRIVTLSQENFSGTSLVLTLDTNANQILDSSFSDFVFTEKWAMNIKNSNQIDCSLLSSSKCFFKDDLFNNIETSLNSFIILESNTLIKNLVFDKLYDTNNINMIGKFNTNVLRNNITISDSRLSRQDSRTKSDSEIFIDLYSNNVEIVNNIFDSAGNSSASYNIINLEATNYVTNNIHSNSFTSTLASVGVSEIFSNKCDAQFYHNYIDSHYNVTNGCSGTLNVSPLIPYLHSNTNVYYYRLGNFYEANSPCTDGDSDGICDSSFTSGSVTDTHPLSVYPFDFEGQIFNAEFVVTESDFNISLITPTDLQSFSLGSGTETINLSFSHDSDFPDLTCDYVVNGIALVGGTITNTPKDSTNSILANGWTTQNNTFRVECYNSLVSEISNEITFETLIGTTGGGNGNGGSTPSSDNLQVTGTQIFNADDISGTTDNFIGFFGDIGGFLFNILVPAVIFISIIGAIVFIVVLIGG